MMIFQVTRRTHNKLRCAHVILLVLHGLSLLLRNIYADHRCNNTSIIGIFVMGPEFARSSHLALC
jgi:hypothetical protein